MSSGYEVCEICAELLHTPLETFRGTCWPCVTAVKELIQGTKVVSFCKLRRIV